jgi:hypothetical protein
MFSKPHPVSLRCYLYCIPLLHFVCFVIIGQCDIIQIEFVHILFMKVLFESASVSSPSVCSEIKEYYDIFIFYSSKRFVVSSTITNGLMNSSVISVS